METHIIWVLDAVYLYIIRWLRLSAEFCFILDTPDLACLDTRLNCNGYGTSHACSLSSSWEFSNIFTNTSIQRENTSVYYSILIVLYSVIGHRLQVIGYVGDRYRDVWSLYTWRPARHVHQRSLPIGSRDETQSSWWVAYHHPLHSGQVHIATDLETLFPHAR